MTKLFLTDRYKFGYTVPITEDTHKNDTPEDDSYSVPDDLECIGCLRDLEGDNSVL